MINNSAMIVKIFKIFFPSLLGEKSKEWQFLDKMKVLLSAYKEEMCGVNGK